MWVITNHFTFAVCTAQKMCATAHPLGLDLESTITGFVYRSLSVFCWQHMITPSASS